jgi:beta-mannosidase
LDSTFSNEAHLKWNELAFAIYLYPIPESPGISSVPEKKSLARSINFHEPLKDVPFTTEEGKITIKLVKEDSGWYIDLSVSVPMKCVYLEFEDDEIVAFDDNGLDLVPRETVKLCISPLNSRSERKLRIYWLGETGWQTQVIDV